MFDRLFLDTMTGRMDGWHEAIFKRILDDEEFRQVLGDWYRAKVYRRVWEGSK